MWGSGISIFCVVILYDRFPAAVLVPINNAIRKTPSPIGEGVFLMELLIGFGPMTSSLPMTCSTD